MSEFVEATMMMINPPLRTECIIPNQNFYYLCAVEKTYYYNNDYLKRQ